MITRSKTRRGGGAQGSRRALRGGVLRVGKTKYSEFAARLNELQQARRQLIFAQPGNDNDTQIAAVTAQIVALSQQMAAQVEIDRDLFTAELEARYAELKGQIPALQAAKATAVKYPGGQGVGKNIYSEFAARLNELQQARRQLIFAQPGNDNDTQIAAVKAQIAALCQQMAAQVEIDNDLLLKGQNPALQAPWRLRVRSLKLAGTKWSIG